MAHVDNDLIEKALCGIEEYAGEFDPSDKDYLYFEQKEKDFRMYKFEEIENIPEFFFAHNSKYNDLHQYIIDMKIGATIKISGFESDDFMRAFYSNLFHGKITKHMQAQNCRLERKLVSDEGAVYVRKVKI